MIDFIAGENLLVVVAFVVAIVVGSDCRSIIDQRGFRTRFKIYVYFLSGTLLILNEA